MKPSYESDVRTELSLRYWTEVINDRNSTDLTIERYCKEHDLSRNSYYYWLRKIRGNLLMGHNASLQTSCTSNTIVEIKPPLITPVSDGSQKSNQCIVLKVKDISMEVTPNISPEFLLQVLEVIRNA